MTVLDKIFEMRCRNNWHPYSKSKVVLAPVEGWCYRDKKAGKYLSSNHKVMGSSDFLHSKVGVFPFGHNKIELTRSMSMKSRSSLVPSAPPIFSVTYCGKEYSQLIVMNFFCRLKIKRHTKWNEGKYFTIL